MADQSLAAQKDVDKEPLTSNTNPDSSSTQPDENQEPSSSPKDFTWGDGLSLDVSSTKMKARLEISVEYAECYTANDLYRYLKGNKIVHGVEEKKLQEILEKKQFNEPVVVSQGDQPQHGEDGYVDWNVDLTILDGAKLIERAGRVDWKEQHHVLEVEANELLGRLIDPTNEKPGIDVYGEKIPANPGKPAKFPAGKGVRISEDGKELYSEIKGVICRDGDKISVSQTYSVQGDIDFKTGNAEFAGTIMISGNVLSDFKVIAGNDIHIEGLVESAILEAGGNIYINGGIQGDQKARIKAAGDVNVKFINNATVEAGGNVVVSGSISNSKVFAKKSVLVDGTKAVIVGGETHAEEKVEASILGSDLGVQTKFFLGDEINKKINFKNEQSQKITALMANYKRLQQATTALNQLRDTGKLNKEQADLRLKIIRSGLQVQAQIKRMKEELTIVKEEIERAQKNLVGVIAKEVAWPGCQIDILGNTHAIKAQTSKAIFALTKKEVCVFAYKEEDKKDKKKKDKKASEEASEETKEPKAKAD